MGRLAPATPLRDLTEQEWDGQLFRARKGVARLLGWDSYHTLRSKGSASGFPDRVLWRDRVVYAELKSETGTVSDAQRAALDGLARAGGEVYLWRPSDLEEVGQILAGRWLLVPPLDDRAPLLSSSSSSRQAWRPGSLWLPGVGRADTVPA